MLKKAYIKTYGCQMNEYDSEVMAGLLTKDHYQLTSKPEEADLIIGQAEDIQQAGGD